MVDKNFIGLDKPDITRFESYLPTAFSSELTLLQKVNKIIQDLNRSFDLTNEMVDYLNRFIEMFDEKLYETLEDVLTVWIEDGRLADVVRVAISEEVIEARTDYLGKKYGNLKERLDSEKADIVEVTAQLAETTIKITDNGLNIRDFGGHTVDEVGYENFDNKDAIISALNYAVANNIAEILLPSGMVKTSPISFEGYENITLKGSASSYMQEHSDQRGTTLQIISSGDVGLQFSSTTRPHNWSKDWKARSCKVENIKLDCNNMVRCGINGNYDFTLENVAVVNAIEDGIILEDYTYPAKLINVFSAYNGRHGLYVKGPMTTTYSVTNSEFSRNGGYGVLLECGAYAQFDSMKVQANARGGMKLSRVNGESTLFYNLLFNSFYSEANGTLPETDINYEGNWSVIITTDQLDANVTHKVRMVKFHNSAINRRVGGVPYPAKGFKIDAVYGLTLDNSSAHFEDDSIPTPEYCASMFTTSAANKQGVYAPYPFITPYGKNSKENTPFQLYNGGVMGTRGRVQLLTFYVPSIQPGQTVQMIPTSNGGLVGILPDGYPLLKESSIIGAQLITRGTNGTGSLTADFVYGYKSYFETPNINLYTTPSVKLDLSVSNRVYDEYEPLSVPLNKAFMIGYKLTASSDYSYSGTSGTDKSVLLQVLIES